MSGFFDLLHHPRMTPHLHLCLQSGSERILLQMRRQYTAAQYQAIVDAIRARDPHFNITTDIIVGFPSESEGDFARSREMVRRNTLGHVHIFPYAVRSGTRAARMTGQQESRTITARCKELKGEADAAKLRYRESIAGVAHMLLTESEHTPATGSEYSHGTASERLPAAGMEGAMVRGYSQYYVPLQTARRHGDQVLALNRFYPMQVNSVGMNGDEPILHATPRARAA